MIKLCTIIIVSVIASPMWSSGSLVSVQLGIHQLELVWTDFIEAHWTCSLLLSLQQTVRTDRQTHRRMHTHTHTHKLVIKSLHAGLHCIATDIHYGNTSLATESDTLHLVSWNVCDHTGFGNVTQSNQHILMNTQTDKLVGCSWLRTHVLLTIYMHTFCVHTYLWNSV